MTHDPLLKVHNLAVSYRLDRGILVGRGRSVDAVKQVSFEIAAGQGFGLVGESGSGKTTVGRAILCLASAADGSIVFDGREITQFGHHVPLGYRRDVQVVFQDPRSSLNPRRTVFDILGQIVQRHFGSSKQQTAVQVSHLLDKVGLASYHAHRYPGELSGGQRQRVAIARALATKPRLLVCDEPVSALDVSTQSQILNLLTDLRRDLNLAYLFISHDLAVVRQVVDFVAVMRRGRIVEAGPSEALYTNPTDPYTKMLLSSVPDSDPRRREERRALRMSLRAATALP
ncbi:MAG TPA: ATP-binding cassette domain-containing protein [Pseudolabrys sp.]|jgi:ABC-type oligopeptide transport system ATPase subunit|nr:ATP-binding cassette domain-containing protein [Pseudolabrys sp.]